VHLKVKVRENKLGKQSRNKEEKKKKTEEQQRR
jgi:hypothetical protein